LLVDELKVPEQIAVWEGRMSLAEYQVLEPDPQLIARTDAPRSRQHKALDLGCGWGRHLIYLARQGWQITGLDWAQSAVTHAREALAELKLPGRVIKGNLRKPPFGDSEFQLVVATDVLQHGRRADFKRAMLELKRILRIGGQAVVSVPTVNNAPPSFAGIWIEPNTLVMTSGVEAGLPHHFFTVDEVRLLTRMFRGVEIDTLVEPLPAGIEPLHDEHLNEWLWITLTG
jgi:SAM-dependent methyltransferase